MMTKFFYSAPRRARLFCRAVFPARSSWFILVCPWDPHSATAPPRPISAVSSLSFNFNRRSLLSLQISFVLAAKGLAEDIISMHRRERAPSPVLNKRGTTCHLSRRLVNQVQTNKRTILLLLRTTLLAIYNRSSGASKELRVEVYIETDLKTACGAIPHRGRRCKRS